MKLLTMEDLTKAAGGLGGHFTAGATMHKAVAAHHEALHKHHSEMAAFAKGKHDAMDDGHEMKSYMGKAAEHHAAKAAHHDGLHKLHKAYGEQCDETSKAFSADKAAGAPAPAPAAAPVGKADGTPDANASGEGVAALISKTTDNLVAKALDALNSDPKVAERIQEIVLQRVNDALGNKIVPDHVRGVMPIGIPGGSATGVDPSTIGVPVPRTGAAPIVNTAEVDPMLRHLVEL